MPAVLVWIARILLAILLLVLLGPFLVPVPPLKNTVDSRELAGPDSRFIEINGLNVHYQQYGQGEPHIILLHGFGASNFSWHKVTADLAKQGTVTLYDRAAFGLTERPLPADFHGTNPYTPEASVDLLFDLMDALKIERAILVGNSAGGTVALKAALAQPERVQGLVLVDAAVYTTGGASAWLRWLYQTPQMNHLGPLLTRTISTRGMQLLDLAWHDTSRITPAIVEGYRLPLRVHNWDRALWEFTKASRSADLSGRLGELRMPALVVTGDDDRIVPTANSLRLAKEISGAELAVFEQCGHVPQEECPQAFLAAVQPFIEQVQLPGGQ